VLEQAPPLTSGRDPAGRARPFEVQGYWIERGLVSAAEAAYLRDYFMERHRERAIAGYDDGLPETDILHRYPRLVHPHRTDDVARRYMLDPRIFAVLRELFGEEPLAAQSMVYFKPPGARGQGLHQDQMPLRVSPGTCIAAWVALDRADAENGGLAVVPGSHRLGVLCTGRRPNAVEFFDGGGLAVPEGYRIFQPELEPGDGLFFGGLMIHGSYANRSRDRFRRCFIGHYVGRSAEALSSFYHPLLTEDGQEVGRAPATGGGPCGSPEAMEPH
jgi:phytanoyl-CoA hydroxylase